MKCPIYGTLPSGGGGKYRTLRQLAVWPLSANKRECPVGTPSLFVTPDHAHGRRERPPCTPPLTRWGELAAAAPRIAAGHPRALRRPGGRRSARRRTIPRRRSAAPSGQGERPFVKCGIAAKPAAALPGRGSKPPAATPSGRCSRNRSAAAGKDSGSYAQCCRPSQRPRRGYPF